MAEIRPHKCSDGRVSYRVRVYGNDGRRLRRTFQTKGAAEKWARAIEADRDRGTLLDPRLGKTPLAQIADEWLATLDVEPKTLEDYESLWRTHVAPLCASRRVDSVKPAEIKLWVKRMREGGLSSSRIRKAHLVLRKIFDEAVENGYVMRSPVPALKIKKDAFTRSPPRLPLSAEDVSRIALAMRNREIVGRSSGRGYEVLVIVGFDTGLRPGELRALKRDRCHIDAETPYLEIVEAVVDVYGRGPVWKDPKDHEQRVVRLSPSAASLLSKHLQERVPPHPEALVFPSLEGDLLHWGNFNKRVWKKALKASGVPNQPVNALRHACGSTLARAAVPLHEIKELLGHASVTTTEQYLHLYPRGGGAFGLDLISFKEQDILGTLCSGFFNEVRPEVASEQVKHDQAPVAQPDRASDF